VCNIIEYKTGSGRMLKLIRREEKESRKGVIYLNSNIKGYSKYCQRRMLRSLIDSKNKSLFILSLTEEIFFDFQKKSPIFKPIM
jgi:hypothetical protein